jgi:hypothetical protein
MTEPETPQVTSVAVLAIPTDPVTEARVDTYRAPDGWTARWTVDNHNALYVYFDRKSATFSSPEGARKVAFYPEGSFLRVCDQDALVADPEGGHDE